MPDTQSPEGTAAIASQSIELLLTGKPDVPYKWGTGSIRPRIVIVTYRQDGIRAHLYGVWVREDGQPADDPCDQEYRVDDADWPDWLVELAAVHDPRTKAADRATVLREAADTVFALDFDELRATSQFDSHRQAWELGTIDASTALRRRADEAPQEPDPSWPRRAWDLGLLHKGGDPQPETALALLYRHGLPEDVIDGALCLHAQELAALQRTRMDELDLVGQKARIVGRIVDLIDPTKTPVSSAVAQPAEPALRDRIAAAIWERQNPGRRYADCEYRWKADAEADADAVMAVLFGPIPAGIDVSTWTAIRAIQLMNEAGQQRDAAVASSIDRASVYTEVADRLAADAEQGAKEGFTRIYQRSAAKQVREWGEELRRVNAETHACSNCEGIDPDTCWMNPDRPAEQCPAAEFDDYGQQCTKPSGHNLHSFEEQQPDAAPPAVGAQQPKEADRDRIVAYRSALPGAFSVYCTNHTDELGGGVMPLTSDDLPNGGVCAGCGVDVLIPPVPEPGP